MLEIDKETCVSCGLCKDICAFAAIRIVDGCPQVAENCTLCGACVDVCAAEALKIEKPGGDSPPVDLSAWSGIWVFAEFRNGCVAPVSFELLGAGRGLADRRNSELSAVLFGCSERLKEGGLEAEARKLIAHGADRVYLADDPALADFSDDCYGNVLSDLIMEHKPEVILAGATAIGRSFIPRVATTVATGLTADCTELDIREEDGLLLQTRPAFGGNILATIVCPNTRPQMATVRPMVMKALPADSSRKGEIVKVGPEKSRLQSRVKFIESILSEADQVKLAEADVVICGGRGLENPEGFALMHRLAELLGGAVAATRAAVDAGWIAYPHQVGQTGKTVAPKLYIACGISGAIQHLVGMQSAETIVAINRDPDAPIFSVADYGIVGDLFEVIPKLIERIEERRKG